MFLGKPHRILYEAMHLESGLTSISARVLRPGTTTPVGPFPLVELPAPLSGRYFFDFPTSLTDPEGDHFAFIGSPEDGVFTTVRFSLQVPWVKKEELLAVKTALSDSIAAMNEVLAENGGNVRSLLARLTSARAVLLDNLTNLDSPTSGASVALNAQVIADSIIEIELDDVQVHDIDLAMDDDSSSDIGVDFDAADVPVDDDGE